MGKDVFSLTRRRFAWMVAMALGPFWFMLFVGFASMPLPGVLAFIPAMPFVLLGSFMAGSAMLAWMTAVFCTPVGLWGVIRLRDARTTDPERWRAQWRLFVVGGLALVAWGVSGPLMRLRYAGASACAVRLEPVIVALRDYRSVEGRYPDSLNELVPHYLKEIPTTGALGYRDIYYYPHAEARVGSGGYELIIDMPYGMNFDKFVYWPSEKYPKKMAPGGSVPVGKWAYVHD